MIHTPWPEDELRTRLAAERALDRQRQELAEANTRIAAHARKLSDEVIEQRQEVETARSEAQKILGEFQEVRGHLEIAERRLWDSVDAIEDGFAVFDTEDRLIAANGAFVAPFEELEDVRPGIAYRDLACLAMEEGIIDPEGLTPAEWVDSMVGRWADADRRPVTIRFWNGQFARIIEQRTRDGDMVVLAVNISDEIAREKELEAARASAEAASRAKSSFLANMSHEIRTPMNGVLAMADMLADSQLNEDQRLFVETIKNSGEALLVIINDVLDYSRIEADKLSIQTAPFDLEQCIHDVIVLLQPTAREKGLELIVDYDMFLPTGFVGDQGRLRQVLMNLVGNAIKFTTEGHVLVRVVGMPTEDDATYRIHVAVEDTGIGIPADKQEHIFGEFNQADSDHTRAFDGTGLGLAISRKLIELMGGGLWVESIEGTGSTFGFHVTLPKTAADAALRPELPRWIGRTVVIDANPTSRQVLCKQLVALGLSPEAYDSETDPQIEELTDHDIIFLARPGDAQDRPVPATTFLMLPGPTAQGLTLPDGAQVLFRPFLRHVLLTRLADLAEPAGAAGLDTVDSAPGCGKLRVLAAEDNKTNQLVLRKMLESFDLELEIVPDGKALIDAYMATRPDLVLTDISMPVMDGKTAARAIREIEEHKGWRRCPIIAMTAHASTESEEDILAHGVDHFMTKPLKRAALAEQIAAVRPDAVQIPVAAE